MRNVPKSLSTSNPTAPRRAPERTQRQGRCAPDSRNRRMAKTAVSRARASATASTLSSTVATCESASPTMSREYVVALVARLLTTREATTVAPRSRSTSRSTSLARTNDRDWSRVPNTRRMPIPTAVSQPSPAYSRPSTPMIPAAVLADSTSLISICPGPGPIRLGKAPLTASVIVCSAFGNQTLM